VIATTSSWPTSTPRLKKRREEASADRGSVMSRRTPAKPKPWTNPKRKLTSHPPDDFFHLLAEAAALPRVEREPPGHFFSSPERPMRLLGISNAPKKNSDRVLRGAGMTMGLSREPLTRKLATKKESLMAANPRPMSGM